MLDEVINYFPESIKNEINKYIEEYHRKDFIEEIRFRIERRINLKIGQDLVLLNYIVKPEEIEEIFEKICENSIYTYTKQISEGFITIKGGNRVGITGSAVIENGKIININYISSLNFRVAREIIDVSASLLEYVLDLKNNTIYNTIIASSPGARKNDYIKRFSKKNFKSELKK